MSGAARALALALLAVAPGFGAPPLDTAGMEPAVAEAIAAARAAARDAPSAATWGALGATLHAHGMPERAAEAYARAIATGAAEGDDDFRWRYLAAIAADDRHEPVERVDAAYRRALASRADYGPAHRRLGTALSRRGRTGEAVRAFTTAVELNPDDAASRRALGQALLGLDLAAAAVVHLERAVELAPGDGAAWSALARGLVALGETDEAERAARRASRLEPRTAVDDPVYEREVVERGVSTTRLFERVRRARADGSPQRAATILAALRLRRPQDADVSFLLAMTARDLERPAEAAEHLRRALELDPDHSRALMALAELRGLGGDPIAALELYRRAAAASPADPAPIAASVPLLARAGDRSGVVAAFERLSELSPRDAAVLTDLGTARARAGDLAGARDALLRAVTVDPTHAPAHARLSLVLRALERGELARAAAREAVRLDPASPAGRYVPDGPDPDVPPRVEFEEIARRLREGDNRYHGTARVERLRRRAYADGLDARSAALLRLDLAEALLEAGRVGDAEREVDVAAASLAGRGADGDTRRRVLEAEALVAMRRAEVTNCVERHNADCCIFPLRDGGVHAVDRPARRARDSFAALLELDPGDLSARWLLNLMSMAIGDWPAAVPERWRLEPSAFASPQEVGRFRDVAPGLAVATFNLCGGVVADDFDGDGRLDVLTSTSDPAGPLSLYLADGEGGFSDAGPDWGVETQLGGLNVVGGDYDGDGDPDALVLRGAWLFDDGRIRNSLLRNDGDRLTDVTRQAGLAFPAYPTQAAAWGDLDNDGDLDLYVCNESRMERPDDRADFPSQLFRNDGDGTFTDVARDAGVTNDRYCKGVAAGDYDGDGDLDLYASNVGANRLYRNDGGLRFTDVAGRLGVAEPIGRSFATWFFDYDNDGDLDLFVAAYDADVADLAAEALGERSDAGRPRLYRNDGRGSFTDVAREVGLDGAWLPMGANFGDLDNDGWLDIYLATGDPDYQTLMPNVMLRNDAGRRFVDVTSSGGFGHLQKGHGVAFADLDRDGDEDIYHQIGGFFPGDRFHNVLFENPGHGRAAVTLELVGATSVRCAHGARIRADVVEGGVRRSIHRAVGSVSSFGGSPRRQSIGLGSATEIERLEIRWPASDTVQVFRHVAPGGIVRIVEGHESLERVAIPPAPFRSGPRMRGRGTP